MRFLLDEPQSAKQTAKRRVKTILARHTCSHPIDELPAICGDSASPGKSRMTIAAGMPLDKLGAGIAFGCLQSGGTGALSEGFLKPLVFLCLKSQVVRSTNVP